MSGTKQGMNRRAFVRTGMGVAAGGAVMAQWTGLAADGGGESAGAADSAAGPDAVRFGVIADVHKDIMHDADDRLRAFVEAMRSAGVDFVVQLGDFCVPKEANRGFLDIWNGFDGPRHHVLGNHDTDGGYKREQTVAWWGMPARYYSFDLRGVHFVVLDGNDRPADHGGGYPRYVAQDQREWLRSDLASTGLPTVVFIHQSLEREDAGGVQNGAEVRAILEEADHRGRPDGRPVVACFSGHHHRDYVRWIRGILYPQINSASYYWVGGDYQRVRYSEAIDREYPWIKYTVPYRDPLFAVVTVDPVAGYLRIEGRRSEFVGPAPWDLGGTREEWDTRTLRAAVSDWKMPIS